MPLAPVEAATAEWTVAEGQILQIDPDLRKLVAALIRRGQIICQPLIFLHSLEEFDAHFTRQMIITDAGLAQRGITRTRTHRWRGIAGKDH
ncbi:hypothetical protein P038_00048 [Brucella abortus 99-9971-135]|nr:hypothetical protein BAB8416_I1769 [Brucella abortus]ENP44642.1 hypothetical protein C082_01756 [Brucella abortus 80/102]ENQ10296.1 hypothetical protein C083_01694 [Brucella abortus LEVI237]ENR53901.1 hypothetical protein B991_01540 [Brucella abortus 63/130]ENS22651.1 hypothetical protein C081_01695 [Brucella abortus F5/04-7]ENS49172.1 hypothetical protein B980_00054 [Brucella abortus R42-08]ERS16965.1 hypothetical protein N509_01839 [Brucella abortus BC95]ERT84012.1 hypothetical protein 